jgi:uncharacterized RDD family membrane protein YckC
MIATQRVRSATNSPIRAGFFIRFAAALIDLIAVVLMSLLIVERLRSWLPGPVAFLSRMMRGVLTPQKATQMSGAIEVLAQLFLSIALVGALYFLLEAVFGRSLGKLLLGLRVDTVDGHGSRLGARLLRYGAKVSGAFLVLGGTVAEAQAVARTGEVVAYLTVLGLLVAFSRRRQALHDLVAGTAVFRRVRPAALDVSA